MPLHYEARLTRRAIGENPDTLFVFGDNLARYGMGGQAGECRGMRNAVGVPTKRLPGREPCDYFTDADFAEWQAAATPPLQRLAEHLRAGGRVVWPADGIGTGLAQLPERAPRIWASLERARVRLEAIEAAAQPPTPEPEPHALEAPLVRAVLAAFPGATVVDVREPAAA